MIHIIILLLLILLIYYIINYNNDFLSKITSIKSLLYPNSIYNLQEINTNYINKNNDIEFDYTNTEDFNEISNDLSPIIINELSNELSNEVSNEVSNNVSNEVSNSNFINNLNSWYPNTWIDSFDDNKPIYKSSNNDILKSKLIKNENNNNYNNTTIDKYINKSIKFIYNDLVTN